MFRRWQDFCQSRCLDHWSGRVTPLTDLFTCPTCIQEPEIKFYWIWAITYVWVYVKHSAYLNKFTWAMAWDLKLLIFWSNAFIHFFCLWQLVIKQSSSKMQKWVVKSSRADGSWGCKCVWRLSHPPLQGKSKAFSAIISLVLLSDKGSCLNSFLESVQWGALPWNVLKTFIDSIHRHSENQQLWR